MRLIHRAPVQRKINRIMFGNKFPYHYLHCPNGRLLQIELNIRVDISITVQPHNN